MSVHDLPPPFYPERRRSRGVRVGKVGVGGDNPVRVQSMITCDTMDTAASVAESRATGRTGASRARWGSGRCWPTGSGTRSG